MSLLHLFNPDNDLALAANEPRFTPPAAALQLRNAGALLPLWWAGADDFVLVGDSSLSAKASEMKARFGLDAAIVDRSPAGAIPAPWGWSLYTRNLMADAGVDSSLLPAREMLTNHRMLSHRRTTIAMHRAIGTPDSRIPVEAYTLEEALTAIARFGKAVIKLPWSSSGRGILYSSEIPMPTLRNYISGIIHRQGSAMIEPYYTTKLTDFATLFFVSDNTAKYRGLSLFDTDGRGNYTGNIVMPQSALRDRLGLPLSPIVAKLESALTDIIAPHYNGWLGVDMLSYGEAGEIRINPCVEINLRMTMGIAAMFIAERSGMQGTLRITSGPKPEKSIDLSPTGNRFSIYLEPQ